MLLSKKIIIFGIATVIIATAISVSVIYNFDKSIPKPLEDPGLLVESYDSKLSQTLVNEVIKKYDKEGNDLSSLDNFLEFNINSISKRYVFVIDFDTKKIVAHPNTELLGEDSFALINASESEESILENLKNSDGHWVYYNFINPETGNLEPKTSWFKLHDGLIFGSGFYN